MRLVIRRIQIFPVPASGEKDLGTKTIGAVIVREVRCFWVGSAETVVTLPAVSRFLGMGLLEYVESTYLIA